jgi:cell division protein FtsI (penicillin-binding protein 3)
VRPPAADDPAPPSRPGRSSSGEHPKPAKPGSSAKAGTGKPAANGKGTGTGKPAANSKGTGTGKPAAGKSGSSSRTSQSGGGGQSSRTGRPSRAGQPATQHGQSGRAGQAPTRGTQTTRPGQAPRPGQAGPGRTGQSTQPGRAGFDGPATPTRAQGPGDGRPPRPPRPPAPPPRPPAVLRLGNPGRRLNAALVVMAFVLSLFAGRLIQLQGLDSKVLQAKAAQQRVQPETLPARRGSITDVSGKELAVTDDAREIYVDPADVTPTARDEIATTLAQELNLRKEDIAAKLAKTTQRYIVVARGIDPPRANKIMSYQFKGVGAKATYRRTYPGDTLAGGLIGFVGFDGHGLSGIEQTYDKVLAGQDGKQSVEIGGDGQRIPMTRTSRQAPVPGRNVRLTIDRDIQYAAQEAIARQVRASDARSGSVIVMDIKTGQIVAMANAPEVDLNDWQSVPEADWGNRAVSEVFEPGSTNKVITAAGTIESGAVTPETVFRVPDHITCADREISDAHPHAPEQLTFTGIIAESSNVGTIMAARQITDQRLYNMFRAFGFGAKSGAGVPGEEEGLLPAYKDWSGSQRCTIAYGQGISVTALQMASVYQTIANGGVRITPSIVAGTTDEHGRFVPAPAPRQTRVVSQTTAEGIAGMLEAAVGHDGTGTAASIDGYRVAGKTGTAMRYDEKCKGYCGYTATFVGFTPADAPRLVALAVIQDPQNGHYGGEVAAPVFKDVMTFALKSRKIPPTGTKAPHVVLRAGG